MASSKISIFDFRRIALQIYIIYEIPGETPSSIINSDGFLPSSTFIILSSPETVIISSISLSEHFSSGSRLNLRVPYKNSAFYAIIVILVRRIFNGIS